MILAQTSPRPSVLDPAGSEAHRLAGVWWLIFVLAVVVVVVVLGYVVVALWRTGEDWRGEGNGDERRDNRFIVGGGLVMPVVVLAVAAVATITTTQALRRPAAGEVRVEVVGAQWFWRVRYLPSGVVSANEIRLPVDRPIHVVLRSEDVIHSFWVPQLAGKVDLVPGQTNHLRFTATKVGSYRGECAEFCGVQHAHMAFVVRVVPAAEFDRWIRGRSDPPTEPRAGTAAAQGREVFAASSCAGCHTVEGVSDATAGPDLTDLGDRRTLGAGTLDNRPELLARWIRDPDRYKPGVLMPPTPRSVMSDRELELVVAYLEAQR